MKVSKPVIDVNDNDNDGGEHVGLSRATVHRRRFPNKKTPAASSEATEKPKRRSARALDDTEGRKADFPPGSEVLVHLTDHDAS